MLSLFLLFTQVGDGDPNPGGPDADILLAGPSPASFKTLLLMSPI